MRKLAIVLGAMGLIAFTGVSRADDVKTENSTRTENTTTLGGKHKTTRTKKMVAPDGTTTETRTETVAPKSDEKSDVAEKRDVEKRDADNRDEGATVKTEHHTTLTGKRETKKTKKVENGDGSETTTTTTTTEPNKK